MYGSAYIARMPFKSAPSAKILVFRSVIFTSRQDPIRRLSQRDDAHIRLVWNVLIVPVVDENCRTASGGQTGFDVPPPITHHHTGRDIVRGRRQQQPRLRLATRTAVRVVVKA